MSVRYAHEAVCSYAARLAGKDADEVILESMCGAAAAELEGRLKEGIAPADLGPAFVTAAGVLALSMYCAVSDPEKLKSFRAGDLTVNYGEADADAERLRALAEGMLAGKLRERGFGFAGVRG